MVFLFRFLLFPAASFSGPHDSSEPTSILDPNIKSGFAQVLHGTNQKRLASSRVSRSVTAAKVVKICFDAVLEGLESVGALVLWSLGFRCFMILTYSQETWIRWMRSSSRVEDSTFFRNPPWHTEEPWVAPEETFIPFLLIWTCSRAREL